MFVYLLIVVHILIKINKIVPIMYFLYFFIIKLAL